MIHCGKVLFLKGISQYDVLRVALDEIAFCIKKLGYDVTIIDFYEENSLQQLFEYLNKESYEFVFSFNAILLELTNEYGDHLFNNFEVPIISFLVDNPIYHTLRLASGYKDLSIATFDKDNVTFLKKYFPNLKRSEFIPFFGFEANHIVPYKEREYDVLFVGTYSDPNISKNIINELEGIFKTVAYETLKILLNNTELSLEKALRQYLSVINFDIEDDEFLELMQMIIAVDQYVRSYFRDKVIRTTLEAGILLQVYGTGWESLKKEYTDKLTILNSSEADLMTGIELMGNSKIVLSVMPWFKDCIQDRIISTMLNGAISVTDSSIYMKENLIDGEEIAFYSLNKLEELPGIINDILRDVDNASRIATNGKEKAKVEYSVDIFSKKIIEFTHNNY